MKQNCDWSCWHDSLDWIYKKTFVIQINNYAIFPEWYFLNQKKKIIIEIKIQKIK